MTRDSEAAHHQAGVHGGRAQSGVLKYVPGFLLIFVLYIVGKLLISNPMAPFLGSGLSWNDVLIVLAAMAVLGEQMRVSHPGIDNTIEAMAMGALAVLQILLFALGAAGVMSFGMFSTAEFLMLTLISLAGAVTAIMINARTLRRSIGFGDSSGN